MLRSTIFLQIILLFLLTLTLVEMSLVAYDYEIDNNVLSPIHFSRSAGESSQVSLSLSNVLMKVFAGLPRLVFPCGVQEMFCI